MTVLVDECQWPFRGRLWCHLVSDASFDELHAFARKLGKPRVAFQGDHYDLHETERSNAIEVGAIPIDGRDLVRRLVASGLRRGPALSRRGLTGVAHLPAPEISTDRLRLRQWTDADRLPYQAMCADQTVMTFLGGPTGSGSANQAIDKRAVGLAIRGVGKWAVERTDTCEFVGTVGFGFALFEAPFTPAVELGWRLARSQWGNGFATEAARGAIEYGFAVLGLNEIVAFTSDLNDASRAVMDRLGMRHDASADFAHPGRADDDPHRLQVLYRLAVANGQPQ